MFTYLALIKLTPEGRRGLEGGAEVPREDQVLRRGAEGRTRSAVRNDGPLGLLRDRQVSDGRGSLQGTRPDRPRPRGDRGRDLPRRGSRAVHQGARLAPTGKHLHHPHQGRRRLDRPVAKSCLPDTRHGLADLLHPERKRVGTADNNGAGNCQPQGFPKCLPRRAVEDPHQPSSSTAAGKFSLRKLVFGRVLGRLFREKSEAARSSRASRSVAKFPALGDASFLPAAMAYVVLMSSSGSTGPIGTCKPPSSFSRDNEDRLEWIRN